MVGEFLFHLFQLLAYRFTLLFFQRFAGVLLKGGGHNIHILGLDYSLKKVEQEGKSEYLVFFKAKDVDVMTAAFKEYTSETLKKQKRESVRQKLEKVKEELSNHRQLKKEKKREQEPIR